MENVTIGQHVTLDPAGLPKTYPADMVWTVEWVRPSKQDAVVVSTDDAREGKGHMRRIDRVPFSAMTAAK